MSFFKKLFTRGERAPEAGDAGTVMDFLTGPRAATVGGPHDRRAAWRSVGHLIGHWVMRGLACSVGVPSNSPELAAKPGPGYGAPRAAW